MSTAKGQGVTVYVNPTTVTTNTAYILCAVSNEGGGVESDVIDVEPCLQDVDIERTTQDRKYTAITVQLKEAFSTTANVSSALEALAGSTTAVRYTKKIPTATPVYMSKVGRVVSFVPDAVDRGQDMTATMVIQPTSGWTSSTTAPATV
jgi:hypothetical protein